ncbi:cell envelope integrity protein TolA [Lacihabitans sp. LS3-19]|uniref:cell envelope integrity protein TolA n=1 Tax=Lacihabitans sp. LS3-19 TaxID=2487335 RepID=UPI0020CB8CC1|nr:cell envelope integrity protein TolA [Lacihabitans sp. LS3-19]
MSKDETIKSIFRKINLKDGVSLSDFKKSLVHISVYEAQNQKNPGNSRYVFLGMYAFKGFLADLVSKYIAGNGKQLQQYLGNVFSNDRLSEIFDTLNLQKVVSLHPSLKLENLKHIFALSYLGFLYENAQKEYIKEISLKYFINTSEHFLPKVHALNTIEILKAKAEEILKQKITFLHSSIETENQVLFKTQVLLNLTGPIAEHSSVSQLYAKKKAIKIALKYILEKEAEKPEYKIFIEKQKIAEEEKQKREKAEKQKKHLAFIKEKREKREIEKEIKRKEAKEREIRRVLNKQNAKNRKASSPKTEK